MYDLGAILLPPRSLPTQSEVCPKTVRSESEMRYCDLLQKCVPFSCSLLPPPRRSRSPLSPAARARRRHTMLSYSSPRMTCAMRL